VCAYPTVLPIPVREEDLWNGYPEETNAPYGLAKKMLLVQAQAYRQQYGMNAIVLFPVNLYGPGDNFDPASAHVLPSIIHKVDAAKRSGTRTITLWGDGSATREVLYVEDCARALVLAAARYDEPDPVNIGSGQEISIRDLAAKVCKLMEFDGDIVWDASQPNGQPRRALDVSRARERFGFVASVSLDEGLQQMIEWVRTQSLPR
jgi:GDP-L-fucose synthase